MDDSGFVDHDDRVARVVHVLGVEPPVVPEAHRRPARQEGVTCLVRLNVLQPLALGEVLARGPGVGLHVLEELAVRPQQFGIFGIPLQEQSVALLRRPLGALHQVERAGQVVEGHLLLQELTPKVANGLEGGQVGREDGLHVGLQLDVAHEIHRAVALAPGVGAGALLALAVPTKDDKLREEGIRLRGVDG